MALQKLRGDALGVTYSDPSNPDLTTRFKSTQKKKSLAGIPCTNTVTEVIATEVVDVVIGSETVPEPISVRIRVSGSPHAAVQKKALALSVASKVDIWFDEAVFEGFDPTTPPDAPIIV